VPGTSTTQFSDETRNAATTNTKPAAALTRRMESIQRDLGWKSLVDHGFSLPSALPAPSHALRRRAAPRRGW